MANELYNTSGANGAPLPPAGSGYYRQLPSTQATYTYDAQPAYRVDPAVAQSAYVASGNAAQAAAAKEAKKSSGAKTFFTAFAGAAAAAVLAGSLWAGTGGFGVMNNVDNALAAGGGTQVVLGKVEGNTSVVAVDSASTDLAVNVAAKSLPSVVGVNTYVDASAYSRWYGYGYSSSDANGLTSYGQGSGVIISADGYVLTNNHVVEDADEVRLSVNGQEYVAEIVGTDPDSDLAVLKIDAEGLVPIEIGSSANLLPGQWVMTVGSPLGLEQSVCTGIISSTSRTVTVNDSDSYYYGGGSSVSIYPGMIQTDAVINPGNSGGALVDSEGRLIGINSVLSSYTGNYAGVGFAIPVDYAMSIVTQIIEGKTPAHGQLGVSVVSVDSSSAQRYGIEGVTEGAYVNYVYPGGGADEAGIEQGDVIVAVGDDKIASSIELIAAARLAGVGGQVDVTIVRDGEEMTLPVTLGSDVEAAAEVGGENRNPFEGLGESSDDEQRYSLEDILRFFGYERSDDGGYSEDEDYDFSDWFEFDRNRDRERDAA